MPPKTQRYRPNMDIILLREYITVQPYKCGTLKSKQDAWEKIVTVVNQFINAGYPCQQVCVTERASRDRVKTLIETFKKGEMNSLKASGTDEEYSERDALLAHISSILEDEEVNKPDTKADIKETEHTEFVEGAEVRTTLPAAMQIVIGGSTRHVSEEPNDGPSSAKKKKKAAVTQAFIEYLKQKHEGELQLRKQEIDLARERLELERQEADIFWRLAEAEFSDFA